MSFVRNFFKINKLNGKLWDVFLRSVLNSCDSLWNESKLQ